MRNPLNRAELRPRTQEVSSEPDVPGRIQISYDRTEVDESVRSITFRHDGRHSGTLFGRFIVFSNFGGDP